MVAVRELLILLLSSFGAAYSCYYDKEHKVFTESEVEGKRLMVIGDTHGCVVELMNLLIESGMASYRGHKLLEDSIVILAGDFVNKGPYSLEVIQWLMNNENAYAVTGNHELNALENMDDYDWTEEADDEHFRFLLHLPWTISIPTYNVTVVHAGLMPNWPLEEQTEYIMTRMRNLEEDGDEFIPHEEPEDGGENWAEVYSREQVAPSSVIYGHDAGRGEDGVQEFDYAYGLDTRCVTGGELTGMVLPVVNKEYYSVECHDYEGMP